MSCSRAETGKMQPLASGGSNRYNSRTGVRDAQQVFLSLAGSNGMRPRASAAMAGNFGGEVADKQRRLATAGKLLTPDERRKCCHLVKPATILAWFRQLAARKYDSSEAIRGRPPKPKDVRKLVIKLATEDLHWGYTKIRDALRTGLGIEIGRTTVANILAEAGIEPAPEREKTRTWGQFLKVHRDSLCGCDFFTVEALGLTGTIRYMVLFAIVVKTRAVELSGMLPT
jgi:transposase